MSTSHQTPQEVVIHPIPPIYDASSQILILGSFPSVKSREDAFYYAHAQNRFWRVMAELLEAELPIGTEEKKQLLLSHHIALWDVIASCRIAGSADSSIRDVKANDIASILSQSNVKAIYTNGKTASMLYRKYILPTTGIPDICLPSTSPANAAFSKERLCDEWKRLLVALDKTKNKESP